MNKKIGVYVHVPFCEIKCPYCDFFSQTYNEELLNQYVERVCQDIKNFSAINTKANTLYFGGGTPNLLGTKRLIKIIQNVDKYFSLLNEKDYELTIEMNPTCLGNIDFKLLCEYGVNRISLGLQSAVQENLKVLGRKHTPDLVREVVREAQCAGFKNISLDLMIAVPNQKIEDILYSIDFCRGLNIQHISSYILKIEPGTKYYVNRERLNVPKEELQCDMYLEMCEKLEHYDFIQYEISNFSKKGYESQHNLKYWNSEEYLGVGPSAHSFINGLRFYYPRSMQKFLRGENFIEDGAGGDETEYIILRLRLLDGLLESEFKKRFGYSIPRRYFQNAYKYQEIGLIDLHKNGIRLTKKGFLVSNEVILNLLD